MSWVFTPVYHENDLPEFSPAVVYDLLDQRGVWRVEVKFSGGHDEGGIDDMIFYAVDGSVMDTRSGWSETEPSIPGHYDPELRRYVNDRKPTDTEILLHFLGDPVDSEYGSFDGEYYVYGTLTWDAVARTCTMTGQQTSESYESFEHEF